jgi:hypothetical protein
MHLVFKNVFLFLNYGQHKHQDSTIFISKLHNREQGTRWQSVFRRILMSDRFTAGHDLFFLGGFFLWCCLLVGGGSSRTRMSTTAALKGSLGFTPDEFSRGLLRHCRGWNLVSLFPMAPLRNRTVAVTCPFVQLNRVNSALVHPTQQELASKTLVEIPGMCQPFCIFIAGHGCR